MSLFEIEIQDMIPSMHLSISIMLHLFLTMYVVTDNKQIDPHYFGILSSPSKIDSRWLKFLAYV